MIEIREIRRRDYKKARQFAIQGMHLNWYMDSKVVLDLYARYFWDMELNRATKAYGAYVDGEFAGVLLADMKGEPKKYHSGRRAAYVRFFDWLQRLVAGSGVGTYDEANREMYRAFCENYTPDGEIIFLAADPAMPITRVADMAEAVAAADRLAQPGDIVFMSPASASFDMYPNFEVRGRHFKSLVMDLPE